MNHSDVIVVGAGPTGLMLACELALAGVQCRVLERRDGQSNMTRAFAVHARTLELFDARGLAEDLVPRGVPIQQVAPAPGAVLDMNEFATPYPMVLIAPQSATERLLETRALRLGVQIEYGVELTALRQDSDGVTVAVSKDEIETTERARYVVGCDGSHSVVRALVGIDFVGERYPTHILLADVRLAEPPEEAMFTRNSVEGVVLCVPFGDGWYRVIAWDRLRQRVPLSEPVTGAEIRSAFDRIAGTDFGMSEPRWSSRFLSEHRQARHYRVGRVFVAGDAAHVHSPLGGQGMNTGIGDAMNLGWKLAGAVHGWAPTWLLESYEAERHPVGAQVLKITDVFNKMMVGDSAFVRALARRVVTAVLRFRRPRLAVGGRLTGIGISYPARGRSEHAWTGKRMPDLLSADGRLYELLRDGRFALVAASGTAGVDEVGVRWSDRVRAVHVGRGSLADLPGVVLVRPDGYVAWAAASPTRADVEAAVSDWCGRATFAERQA
ncbi:FAD-dependent monooxygenase [Mycolicibacterium sp.]|uniref:FAD-dependent monooxygenase n=1 Tax=Mycolicibacterium sp. TaxID=2320850 RepID=UPI001A2EBC03|nr:FAD-dependent monooxygenase [Mycolicibacterium sp.]MBJ7340218.1 FAD-dependent monooxygenase [Mycolicibacterium sp.]